MSKSMRTFITYLSHGLRTGDDKIKLKEDKATEFRRDLELLENYASQAIKENATFLIIK